MKKRARLKDIAEALNISVTTVSRALNDKADISEGTKESVLQVAKMLDYRPNYFAKYLMQDHNNILGIIVPRVAHSYFSSMIDGILHTAQANGYFVLIGESLDNPQNEISILEKFIGLNLEGILIAPAYKSDLLASEILKTYNKDKIVLMDRHGDSTSISQVTNNHHAGAILAMDHLQAQGYKRIAHIRGLKEGVIADEINNGYSQSIKAMQTEEIIYTCAEVTPEEGYKAASYFMELSEPPDAIFAISDEAAMGIYRYCYEHSISIPDQLGVIGYSDARKSKYLTPSLSSVSQHSYDMGVYATNIIISPTAPEKSEIKVFKPRLEFRESTKRTKT